MILIQLRGCVKVPSTTDIRAREIDLINTRIEVPQANRLVLGSLIVGGFLLAVVGIIRIIWCCRSTRLFLWQ